MDTNRIDLFFFRVLSVLLLIFTGTLSINAQNKLTGTIYHDGQPVSYATVTLHADSVPSSAIKGYAITDNEGSFTIQANVKKNDWLIVRYLGYKELKKQITDISKTFHLKIEENIQALNEVTVKANYSGIRFSKDTVLLDTKHYTIGTEENIGEVLKKIPGIEVNETGKVSYVGKNVRKVLIDGKDVLSANNNLAINNLPANLMESAEILMNYTGNSITNTFKKDETLALNIKTSKKKKVNGYIQGAGGYKNKYQAKSNLLYIGEKGSISAILSANNRGDAVFSIEDYIGNIVGIDNLLSQKKKTYSLSNEESHMLLPPDNVYEHTNGALAINTTYVPSGMFDFKGNILYNGSFLKAGNHSEDRYFSGNFINKREQHDNDKNHYITIGFQETWKARKNLEVNVSTKFNLGKYGTRQTLENKIIDQSISSNNNKNLLSTQFIQDLNTNTAIGSGIFYSYIHIEASNRKNNYRLLTDSLLLPISYIPAEKEELPYLFLNRTVSRKTDISPEIGYVLPLSKNINLNSSLTYYYSNNKLTYTDEETNADFSKFNKYQAAIRIEKNKDTFRFGLGADFSVNDYRGSISGNIMNIKTFISPKLSMQWLFSPKHSLNISAFYDIKPTEIEYLSRQRRVTGHSEILNGSNITDLLNYETNLSMNYNIFDLYTNTAFFLFASYVKNKNLPKSSISQKEIASTTTYQDKGKQVAYVVKTYLSKGLAFMPVDTKITGSYLRTEYAMILNGIDNQIKVQNLSAIVSFSSRFKSLFNAEAGVEYQYSNNITSNTNVKNTIREWSATGKIHYFHNKVKAYLYGTFLNINNPFFRQHSLDIGFSCEYRMKNLGIKFLGKNLLHLKDMEWIGIYNTPYYTSSSLFKKIPGYLQCSLSYSF